MNPQYPVFNRSRFDAHTLHDQALQESMLATFFGETQALRTSVVAAAHESAAAFSQAVHRVHNVSHFVGGDRLAAVVAQIGRKFHLPRAARRTQAARLILQEIAALEQAVAAEAAAPPLAR
jgi:hypothetical protein